MSTLLKVIVSIEAFRLLAWLVFLVYLGVWFSPSPGLEHEGFILVSMAALVLAFPYWLVAYIVPEFVRDFLSLSPMLLALTWFSTWLLITGLVTTHIWTRQRRARSEK